LHGWIEYYDIGMVRLTREGSPNCLSSARDHVYRRRYRAPRPLMSSKKNYIHSMQDLAREAGALLMSFFGKVSIEYKGDADLVTKADRASERLIVEQIRRQWPEHDLIGEEGSGAKPKRFSAGTLIHSTALQTSPMVIPCFVSRSLSNTKERESPAWFTIHRATRCFRRKSSGSFLNGRAVQSPRSQS